MVRHGDAVMKALIRERRAIPKALQAAAREMEADLKQNLSVPFPPPANQGAPPHARTYRLRDSISASASGDTITVGAGGSGANYATYLEMGTRKMAPRPFMRPFMASQAPRILRKHLPPGMVKAARRGA